MNFELPWNPQDYIHRIGRTGRAGATGDAISLVCIDETDLLRGVQRLLRMAIPWTVEEGFIPDRNSEPQPLRGGGDFAVGGRWRFEPPPRPSQADPPIGRGRRALGRQADSAGTAAGGLQDRGGRRRRTRGRGRG